MPATVVQSKAMPLTSGTTITLALDAATTVGNMLFVIPSAAHTGVSGGGVPSWQLLGPAGATGTIWWGIIESAASTVSMTGGGRSGSGAFQCVEFSGADYAASGVALGLRSIGTSTAPDSGSISPTARSLLVASIEFSSGAWSSGLSEWTEFGEISSASGRLLRPAWRLGNAGTYAASGTLSISAGWGAAILALTETSSGGGANGGAAGWRGVGVNLGMGFRGRR